MSLLTRSERGRRLALLGTAAHPERIPPADAARLVRAYATAPGFEAVDAAMRAERYPSAREAQDRVWAFLDRNGEWQQRINGDLSTAAQ